MNESELKTGPQWYVLKVVTGQENKVRSYIEAEFSKGDLINKELRILIPSEKVYEVKAGKKKVKDKQFFPGYILLFLNLDDGGQSAHVITSIPGVLGFLSGRGWGTSKVPVPLRKSEINKILGKVEESTSTTERLEQSFVLGESVKVIDGPFSGFIGNVKSIFEDRKKVEVVVKIFERNTPVELSYFQIEKIS